jgi:hypothetical protein
MRHMFNGVRKVALWLQCRIGGEVGDVTTRMLECIGTVERGTTFRCAAA